MSSIGKKAKSNAPFLVFGRRFYNNPDQPPEWKKSDTTETKVWYFFDRFQACDWADRMAQLRFGCQVIDIDQGFRVYEMNWYLWKAGMHFNVTARIEDASYHRMEQNCVNEEKRRYGIWWPRRSGREPNA